LIKTLRDWKCYLWMISLWSIDFPYRTSLWSKCAWSFYQAQETQIARSIQCSKQAKENRRRSKSIDPHRPVRLWTFIVIYVKCLHNKWHIISRENHYYLLQLVASICRKIQLKGAPVTITFFVKSQRKIPWILPITRRASPFK
jgi:hypothetical protein